MQTAIFRPTGEKYSLLSYNRADREWLKTHAQQEELCCVCCGEPVVLAWGEVVIPHFRHRRESSCLMAKMPSLETPEHIRGKERLYQLACHLFPQARWVEMERFFPDINRVADVAVEDENGSVYAFEYQRSNIRLDEIAKRRRDYRRIGVKDLWFLGENRLRPHITKAKHFTRPMPMMRMNALELNCLQPARHSRIFRNHPFRGKQWFLRTLDKEMERGDAYMYDAVQDRFYVFRRMVESPRATSVVCYTVCHEAKIEDFAWSHGELLTRMDLREREIYFHKLNQYRLSLQASRRKDREKRGGVREGRSRQVAKQYQALDDAWSIYPLLVNDIFGWEEGHPLEGSRQLKLQEAWKKEFKEKPERFRQAWLRWHELKQRVILDKYPFPFVDLPIPNDVLIRVPRPIWQAHLFYRMIFARKGYDVTPALAAARLREDFSDYIDVKMVELAAAAGYRMRPNYFKEEEIRPGADPLEEVAESYFDFLAALGLLVKQRMPHETVYVIVSNQLPVFDRETSDHILRLYLTGRLNHYLQFQQECLVDFAARKALLPLRRKVMHIRGTDKQCQVITARLQAALNPVKRTARGQVKRSAENGGATVDMEPGLASTSGLPAEDMMQFDPAWMERLLFRHPKELQELFAFVCMRGNREGKLALCRILAANRHHRFLSYPKIRKKVLRAYINADDDLYMEKLPEWEAE